MDSKSDDLIEHNLAKFETDFKEKENDLKALMTDSRFLSNLRFISISLNNTVNNSFQWDLLEKYNIFRALTKLLEFYFNTLKVNDDEDSTIRPLRDLVEVIYKISHRSLKFVAKFTNYNMLEMFIDLFKRLDLIEFFYEAFLNVLSKLISIFYYICKKEIHIIDTHITFTGEHFNILSKARDLIEKLSVDDKRTGLQGKPIFRLFLTCLSYVQVRFRPNESLVSLNNFRDGFENGYIHREFRKISCDLISNGELIEYEFPNENDQLELQKVHKLNIFKNSNAYEAYWYFSTFEQIIDNMNVLCFDVEKKIVGYEYYKYFIKSLIIYGLDIEKLLSLKCLNNFLEVDKVKTDLMEDENFIWILKNMEAHSNLISKKSDDEMQKRLNTMIRKTLDLIFN